MCLSLTHRKLFLHKPLGSSKSFTGENNATVFITGNHCTVSPDLRRRSLFSELFIEAERAEDRQFARPLEVPQILERRADILSALWGLVKNWDDNFRPSPSRGHSSFPEWANAIGAIVEHSGYGCPMATPENDAAADIDGSDMRGLVTAICDGSSMKVVDFEELTETARTAGLFERFLADEFDRGAKAKFASILKGYDRRLVGSCRFTLIGKGRNRRFQVEKVTK